jgi:NADPH:quinone reductase-like Zn-dependent oxidoreductase
VIDYHDHECPAQVRALTANRGADAAANAVPGGAARATEAVADSGRLATITSDPPAEQRGITVSSFYVRPNGIQMRALATRFADRQLQIRIAASYRLADAAQALAQVTGGHAAGAVVLTP